MISKTLIFLPVILVLTFLPLFAQDIEAPVWTLEQCLKQALENNPQVRSSHFTVQESEARVDEVRAGFYPTLNINGSAGRHSFESPGQSGFSNKDSYDTGIYARYPIFEGFRTLAASQAAKASFQADQSQYRQDQDGLILNVTEAYYRLLQAERLVEVAQQSLKRAQVHLDYAGARFEAGLAARSDILKAKVEQSNSQLALIRARNAQLAAAGRLNVQLGRPAHHAIQIRDDLEAQMFSSPKDSLALRSNTEELIDAALQSRPELVKIEQNLKAQQAAVRMARSEYFPTISLNASYDYSGEAPSDLQASSYVGVSVSFPLFSGFARPARVAQEKWRLESLSQQQQALRLQVSLEVWNALLAFKEAAERISNTRIFYDNSLENLRIAEGEYKEGVGSMLDVIDAQTALVTAEESHIEALADFQIARAALERAVGRHDIEEMLK